MFVVLVLDCAPADNRPQYTPKAGHCQTNDASGSRSGSHLPKPHPERLAGRYQHTGPKQFHVPAKLARLQGRLHCGDKSVFALDDRDKQRRKRLGCQTFVQSYNVSRFASSQKCTSGFPLDISTGQ